jgi:hypothetical protein
MVWVIVLAIAQLRVGQPYAMRYAKPIAAN